MGAYRQFTQDEDAVCSIDDGTMIRGATPPPGPVGSGPFVEGMSLNDRFISVLYRTVPLLPGEIQQEFSQMLSATNLSIAAGTLVVWAGSHYFGVGFVADAILVAAGEIFLGAQVGAAAVDLFQAIKITVGARSSIDLDLAAHYMAKFIGTVGVAVFTALVFKGAKRVAPKARAAVAQAAAGRFRFAGMTPKHYSVFQQVAQETKRIIAVRNTNPKSAAWIERGFPAKPIEVKVHTSAETGIVTALKPDEVIAVQKAGFYVVDSQGIPRGIGDKAMPFSKPPDWPVQRGQVIHPQLQKPLVGDYDLLGVIDPKAPGRNIVLVASEGKAVKDISNPDIRRIAQEINTRLDQPRVMHGAHDGFADLPDKDGSVVFFPDGSTRHLVTPEDVEEFYRLIGRQTIKGSYN